jgi:hypothetical protein
MVGCDVLKNDCCIVVADYTGAHTAISESTGTEGNISFRGNYIKQSAIQKSKRITVL